MALAEAAQGSPLAIYFLTDQLPVADDLSFAYPGLDLSDSIDGSNSVSGLGLDDSDSEDPDDTGD